MTDPDEGSAIVNTILSRLTRFAVIGACAILTAATATTLSLYLQSPAAAQTAGEVRSLRGDTAIPATEAVPELESPDTRSGSFERAYRQQPPLIPHTVEGDEITRTVNQCIQCHAWPYNVDQGAPQVSETHYVNREGVALDQVSSSRWFCTQCHVPQTNAKELVNNDFKSAADLD